MSLADAVKNHPLLVTVSAASLVINFATAAWSAYSEFFGDRPIIVEEYVQTKIAYAEREAKWDDPNQTGRLEPFGCRVVLNEIREYYNKIQNVSSADGTAAHILSAPDGTPVDQSALVVYLVIHNRGDAIARDVIFTGVRWKTPKAVSLAPELGGQEEMTADYYALVGMDTTLGGVEEAVNTPVGALGGGDCVALPIAISQFVDDETGGSDILAGPAYRVDSITFRRAFGLLTETQEIRPMNPVAVSIAAHVEGRG